MLKKFTVIKSNAYDVLHFMCCGWMCVSHKNFNLFLRSLFRFFACSFLFWLKRYEIPKNRGAMTDARANITGA